MANHSYKTVYKPSHKRAYSNGMVYEHIIKAEEYLGRELQPGEVVHHEDENKHNNSKENLFVFKTGEDHLRYHKLGVKIQLKDGSWIAPEMKKVCPVCGKNFVATFQAQISCSIVCRSEKQKVVLRPSKEELFQKLKEGTFTAVGREFGVSDNTIRKWCRLYGMSDKAKDYK